MSTQRARAAVAAEHRSIHPNLAGVPWWAAIVVAVTATVIGFAFDAGSGDKELSQVFGALYVLGCVMAVLIVAQSDLFTTVVQPPLILFCTVPGAYWLFHGATFNGVKNILINCGYPLIERFPLMLFTSAGVLVLGLVRWYLGTTTGGGHLQAIAAKLASAWPHHRPGDDDEDDRNKDDRNKPESPGARRQRPAKRPARPSTPARGAKANGTPARGAKANGAKTTGANRPAPPRSRRSGPPTGEPAGRPRQRPAAARRAGDSSPEPRRRPRETREPVRRDQRDGHRDSRARTERPARGGRAESSYQRPAARHGAGAATHHPVSRVRYRGETSSDEL